MYRVELYARVRHLPAGRAEHQDVVHEAQVEQAGPRHPLARANFSFWLQTDIQLPEIEVRLYPNKRHFGQGWECLKVTHSRPRQPSGYYRKLLNRSGESSGSDVVGAYFGRRVRARSLHLGWN